MKVRVARLACAPREAKIGADPRTGARGWVSSLALLRHSLLVLILACGAAPAYADDPVEVEWVAMPPAQAAFLKKLADEHPLLIQQVELQRQEIAALKRLVDLQDKLLALKDAEVAAHGRLEALEGQRADYWAGRVENVERAACTEVRKARVAGGAATGAALGSAAMPGPGTLVGAGLGAVVGWFMPCP